MGYGQTPLSKIRYLIKRVWLKWIFLDHLSIVISGIAGDDERRLIDNTMIKLRSLVEETGCGMMSGVSPEAWIVDTKKEGE